MRRYITERVGILECFQIILAMIALCLGFYAFATDVTWNARVDRNGINACIDINIKLVKDHNATILYESECDERLDKHGQKCVDHINAYYLTRHSQQNKFTFTHDNSPRNVKRFIQINMRRQQASETSFLVTICCIAFVLMAHMLVASFWNNIEVRTKWNAALQGMIFFACGFSAMLLAVSMNTIDNKYIKVANQLEMCGLLRFCDRSVSSHPELSKELEVKINDALLSFHACQDVKVKQSICVLLGILAGTCLAEVLLAVDLNSKYEQASEEQEVLQEETTDNLDHLIEEENVVFENPPASGDNPPPDENPPPAPPSPNKLAEAPLHLKSGSTVIAEYLAVKRPHS